MSRRAPAAPCRARPAPHISDKLLPLPGFLWRPDAPAGPADIVAGLILTRHFLLHHLLEPQGGAAAGGARAAGRAHAAARCSAMFML